MTGKKAKGQRWIKTVLTVLLVICIGTGIGFLFTPIFDIQEVYCEGNNRVSSVTLAEAAQENMGKNIIFQRLSQIEKKIKEIPEIEDADVKRVFPNKIKIQVVERIPAGYFVYEDKCVAVDLSGRVLNISEGEQATGIIEYLTPDKLEGRPEEKPEEKPEEEPQANNEEADDGENSENSQEVEGSENQEDVQENSGNNENLENQQGEADDDTAEPEEVNAINIPYEIPLIVGIEIKSTGYGKTIQSKEEDKLNKINEVLNSLEKAGILGRITYFDATDLNDIILVIEKRLEVQMGNTDNIEYRCAFLAKVVNEKISSTEYAVLDYKGDDIYVRQPDDGKERVVPKPTPTPTPTPTPEPSDDAKEENEDEEEAEINSMEE